MYFSSPGVVFGVEGGDIFLKISLSFVLIMIIFLFTLEELEKLSLKKERKLLLGVIVLHGLCY